MVYATVPYTPYVDINHLFFCTVSLFLASFLAVKVISTLSKFIVRSK